MEYIKKKPVHDSVFKNGFIFIFFSFHKAGFIDTTERKFRIIRSHNTPTGGIFNGKVVVKIRSPSLPHTTYRKNQHSHPLKSANLATRRLGSLQLIRFKHIVNVTTERGRPCLFSNKNDGNKNYTKR